MCGCLGLSTAKNGDFHPGQWSVIDVRDLAASQRLMAESVALAPGARYTLAAPGPVGRQPGRLSVRGGLAQTSTGSVNSRTGCINLRVP